MWSPGYSSFFLFLLLELTPQPGNSQGGHLFKYCDCDGKMLNERDITQNFDQILVERANFTVCPHNIIRFVLPKRIYCGRRTESWVDNVTERINQRRTPFLQPSENQQDFSKGSNKKPPTTTQEPTTSTTKTAPSLRLSTQTWKGGTSKPSEITREEFGTTQKIQETTIGLTTAVLDTDQNNYLLQGQKPPTEKSDEKSKTKQMSIAIISLISIVLVFSAVGTYFWCRKAKFTNCTEHCVVETVKYQPTPLDEIESGP